MKKFDPFSGLELGLSLREFLQNLAIFVRHLLPIGRPLVTDKNAITKRGRLEHVAHYAGQGSLLDGFGVGALKAIGDGDIVPSDGDWSEEDWSSDLTNNARWLKQKGGPETHPSRPHLNGIR